MKKGSILIFIIICFNLIFTSFYGGPIANSLLYLSIILPVLSLIYILYVKYNIKLEQKCNKVIIVQHSENEYIIKLTNNRFLPFVNIKFVFYEDNAKIEKSQLCSKITISPQSVSRLRTGIYFSKRGVYKSGIKKIIISDLFGIFRVSYKPKDDFIIKVYPPVNKIKSLPFQVENLAEGESEFKNPKKMDIPDVDVRKYQKGDSLKIINWKLSAKKGEFFTKKYIQTVKKKIMLIMDLSTDTSKDENIETQDKIIQTSVALLNHFVENNIPCGIHYYNKNIVGYDINNEIDFNEFYNLTPLLNFSSGCSVSKIIECCNTKKSFNLSTQYVIVTENINQKLYDVCLKLMLSGNEIVLMFVNNILIKDTIDNERLKIIKIDSRNQTDNAISFK